MNIEKEKRAIQYLQSFAPADGTPYYGCYSGGKDSDVIYLLSKLAGVNVEWVHNLTTVDAPETVYYVRSKPDVKIVQPQKTMWELIPEKSMPPTRVVRYCCVTQKETGGKFRKKITGVRWAESTKRADLQGIVSVLGKTKTNEKLAGHIGANYRVNKQGGGNP